MPVFKFADTTLPNQPSSTGTRRLGGQIASQTARSTGERASSCCQPAQGETFRRSGHARPPQAQNPADVMKHRRAHVHRHRRTGDELGEGLLQAQGFPTDTAAGDSCALSYDRLAGRSGRVFNLSDKAVYFFVHHGAWVRPVSALRAYAWPCLPVLNRPFPTGTGFAARRRVTECAVSTRR